MSEDRDRDVKVLASNNHGWSLVVEVDYQGIHVGANHPTATKGCSRGLYLTDEEIDKVVIRLLKAKSRRKEEI